MKRLDRVERLVMMSAAAWLLAVSAWGGAVEKGATNEIAGLKGAKVIETDHYRLYYLGESPAKFKNIIEKMWSESAKVLPRLELIARTGELDPEAPQEEAKEEPKEEAQEEAKEEVKKEVKKTVKREVKTKPRPSTISPTGAVGPRTKSEPQTASALKFTLVFAERRPDYETAARSVLPPNLPDALRQQAEAAIQTAPTITQDNQTRIYWTGDPNMKTKGYEIFLCHAGAADLLQINQGEATAPFWLAAGIGYYMEFKFFNKSVTGYMDYEKYYSESTAAAGGKFNAKETLAIGQPWAPILKRLMQVKGKQGDLKAVLAAETGSLTPETCGYIYAFVSYLLSDAKRTAAFRKFLEAVRQDAGRDVEKHLLESLDRPDLETLQKDWHAFILGNQFK